MLEYIFLPKYDENNVKMLWRSLARIGEQLSLPGIEYEDKNINLHLNGIQRAESVDFDRYLFMYHKIAIIILEEKQLEGEEVYRSINDLNRNLSCIESMFGRVTLMVNPTVEERKMFTDHFAVIDSWKTALHQGEIEFFSHDDDQEIHHLMIYHGSVEKKILLNYLPTLMANIFSLIQKKGIFQDHMVMIAREKNQLDSGIGSTMHQQLMKITDHRDRLSLMEKMVESLAQSYSTMSANVSVLLQDQGMLEKEYRTTITQIRRLTVSTDNFWYTRFLLPVEELNKELVHLTQQVQISIANAKTSIEILQVQINLIRSTENLVIQEQMRGMLNQNLALQQEAVTLQIGAGFIEFIVIMYYALAIVKTIAPDITHLIPGGFLLIIDVLFSGMVVWLTHKIGKSIMRKKHIPVK